MVRRMGNRKSRVIGYGEPALVQPRAGASRAAINGHCRGHFARFTMMNTSQPGHEFPDADDITASFGSERRRPGPTSAAGPGAVDGTLSSTDEVNLAGWADGKSASAATIRASGRHEPCTSQAATAAPTGTATWWPCAIGTGAGATVDRWHVDGDPPRRARQLTATFVQSA